MTQGDDPLGASPLDDYDLEEEIARGGMGVVYKAWQNSLQRWVAVKMLTSERVNGVDNQRRFRLEAEAVARLQHPGIVPVFEFGEHQNQPFYAMEFVTDAAGRPAPTLASLVSKRPLAPKAAVTYVRQVTEAVAYAHEQKVVHRDLKPANILVDRADRPRVTDFGLARILENESSLTESGQPLGTPAYMPPEQVRGDLRSVGPLSDVYSLGAVLYHLLTGHPPFTGASAAAIQRQVLEEDPIRLRKLDRAFPADLEAICFKCLEKEPHRRYESAKQLAAELDNWLNHKPVGARPIGPVYRLLKWIRRKPAVAGLALLALLALLIGTAGIWWQAAQRREAGRNSQLANTMSRAEAAFADDQSHTALTILSEYLRQDPNRVVAERLINALQQRVFLVPDNAQSYAQEPLVTGGGDLAKQGLRSPDGKWRILRPAGQPTGIELQSQDGQIRWRVENAHARVIRSAAWDRASRKIMTAAADHTVKVWDASNGHSILTKDFSAPLYFTEFSPAGEWIATAAADGTAWIWNLETRASINPPIRHHGAVNSARFSSDGKWLVTASDDGSTRVWLTDSGLPLSEPFRPGAMVADAWFDDNDRRVVVRTLDQKTFSCRISLATDYGPPPASLPPAPQSSPPPQWLSAKGSPAVLAISAAGHWAALGVGSAVQLWDARTRRPRDLQLDAHAEVCALRFSPDGRRLAAGSIARELRLWDVETGILLADPVTTHEPITNLWFSADGIWLMAPGGFQWSPARIASEVPEWLRDIVAAMSITPRDQPRVLPSAGYYQLTKRLARIRNDPLAGWGLRHLSGLDRQIE